MPSNVKVNLSGITAFKAALGNSFSPGGVGPLNDWLYTQVPARYSEFSRRRFDRLSKSGGGGEWPPLKESTILSRRVASSGRNIRGHRIADRRQRITQLQRQRRKAKTAEKVKAISGKIRTLTSGAGTSILRDTGTLMNALSIGHSGNRIDKRIQAVAFGFRGAKHPGGKVTVKDIATFHQTGAGPLPVRAILVQPDEPTRRGMLADGTRAMQQALRTAAIRGPIR